MEASKISDLISHMEWADALIWKSVLDVPSLQTDKWMRERLLHFHATQRIYGQIILGFPYKIPEMDEYPDLRSIGLWVRQFYKEIFPDLTRLNDSQLQQTVEFPWAAKLVKNFGSVAPATVGDSILQMVMHTAHHRGQVAARLREAGGKPQTTDYILWIWMAKPAPDWGILDIV